MHGSLPRARGPLNRAARWAWPRAVQRGAIDRSSDVDGARDKVCWRELSLQLLAQGVIIGRGVLPNAAITDAVRALPGRLNVLSVSYSKSAVCMAFCMGAQGA